MFWIFFVQKKGIMYRPTVNDPEHPEVIYYIWKFFLKSNRLNYK